MSADTKKPQKILILDTMYSEKTDLVQWKVQFEDGNQVILAWPSKDLGNALGIKGKIEPHHIIKFNEEIKGKTKNIIIEGAIRETKKIKEMTEEQILEQSRVLDEFPFYEVMEQMGVSMKEKQ